MWFFYVCWFIVGFGIGGEYLVINLVIDEFILVQYCGWVDLFVNGIYWVGVMFGLVVMIYFFDLMKVVEFWGWCIGFFIGLVFGIVVIFICKYILELFWWMLMYGYGEQVEEIVVGIEQDVWELGYEFELVSDDQVIILEFEVRC